MHPKGELEGRRGWARTGDVKRATRPKVCIDEDKQHLRSSAYGRTPDLHVRAPSPCLESMLCLTEQEARHPRALRTAQRPIFAAVPRMVFISSRRAASY